MYMSHSQFIHVYLVHNNKYTYLTLVNVNLTIHELNCKIINNLKKNFNDEKFIENYSFIDKKNNNIRININQYYNKIYFFNNIIHISKNNNKLFFSIYIKINDDGYFQNEVNSGNVNIICIDGNIFKKTIKVPETDNFSIVYSKIHNFLNSKKFYIKTNEDINFCNQYKQKINPSYSSCTISDYIYKSKDNQKYLFFYKSNIYKFK